MNIGKLIRRDDGMAKATQEVEKASDELQTALADELDNSLDLGDLSLFDDGGTSNEDLADGSSRHHDTIEATRQLTSHAQSRLAALGSFDGLFHDAEEHLEEIKAKLLEVSASYHYTREFFTILRSDIVRANELETANAGLTTEHRLLSEQLHDAAKKLRERESALGAMQQRETSLVQDRDALRDALAAVRLELVEAANASAKKEAEFGEVVKELSARSAEANRRSRENDILREKHVRLSIELDKAVTREVETRRRLDELSTIHATEAARHSELQAAFGKSEKEEMRLQKSLEIAQAKLSEMAEAARILESDREAELVRNLAEVRGLRSEIQNLQSRLEMASNEAGEASAKIANLTAQWSDALAEKQIADERLSLLMKESQADKTSLSALKADFSQLSVQQASEQIHFDVQRQECEDLRGEIAALGARIKELLPYERIHKVTSARERDSIVQAASVAAETSRPTSRRRARQNLRAAS